MQWGKIKLGRAIKGQGYRGGGGAGGALIGFLQGKSTVHLRSEGGEGGGQPACTFQNNKGAGRGERRPVTEFCEKNGLRSKGVFCPLKGFGFLRPEPGGAGGGLVRTKKVMVIYIFSAPKPGITIKTKEATVFTSLHSGLLELASAKHLTPITV